MRAHDVRVVLTRGASKGFETNHQQQNTDARTSEHATTADVPALREETYSKVSWQYKPRYCIHAYMSQWCSSSTASDVTLSVDSHMLKSIVLTEILQPSPIPMPSMLISSVAAGMAADIVAVPMSMDIVLDIPDMVLDIPDMSMAAVVAAFGRVGLIDVCSCARIEYFDRKLKN